MSDPLYLIGAIAGRPVAIDAALVDSVVDLTDVQPVLGAGPAILGLAALRSRVLTVVDCAAALGLADATPPPGRQAGRALPTIVLMIDGYLYGFVLDHVDDVIAADRPIRLAGAPLGGPWTAATTGVVEVAGIALPVVDPAALLAGLSDRAPRAVNAALTPGAVINGDRGRQNR